MQLYAPLHADLAVLTCTGAAAVSIRHHPQRGLHRHGFHSHTVL